METSQTSVTKAPAEVSDIKRKLAWRMGFAGLMIVALLGGLALFDHFSARLEPDAAPPTFTEPVPVPKKAATQPVMPAPAATPAAEPEATAAPVDKAAPPVEPPPRPEVAAKPALPRPTPAVRAAGVQKPAEARPAEAKAAEPKAPVLSAAPAAAAPAAASSAAAQPSPPRLFLGYALQAGVFSDPRRAEELAARLVREGIPATIEARVQVGPFKTRAEADATREKMKGLGVEALLLPPKSVKR